LSAKATIGSQGFSPAVLRTGGYRTNGIERDHWFLRERVRGTDNGLVRQVARYRRDEGTSNRRRHIGW